MKKLELSMIYFALITTYGKRKGESLFNKLLKFVTVL